MATTSVAGSAAIRRPSATKPATRPVDSASQADRTITGNAIPPPTIQRRRHGTRGATAQGDDEQRHHDDEDDGGAGDQPEADIGQRLPQRAGRVEHRGLRHRRHCSDPR